MALAQLQQAFVAYLRRDDMPLPAGTDERHMRVYRELFFNNVNGFVSNAYPVLKSLHTEAQWLALVKDFFARHDCQSPLFIDIAAEFLDYLCREQASALDAMPFMLELAHYELLELQVSVAVDSSAPWLEPTELQALEQLAAKLQLAVTARVAQYQFEVDRISPDFRPDSVAATPVFFCVYRDREEEVRFLRLNPMTAQLLAKLQQTPLSFTRLLAWLAETFPQFPEPQLCQGALTTLAELAVLGIIRKQPTTAIQATTPCQA
ncbi:MULTISPECIES: DNA-binding domain-containing protein [Shewanella]|uniref:HvfC family RiPP maturation protein n=1 Tax=Shewanella TaxID=22 RepID=UPI0008DC9D0D|nr:MULTISPECIES: putative DNA-binding domain-containing protein [Shewanella]EKT4488036.1 putative DNA-binding domain-containing protein [Shewanella algae]MBO2548523.1 putative DNA-binding domain-containing protein [Shewanella algae]MBO2557393.1 putative DNA-binding domain-containing protein [Shewanella algae]MBO2565860.1 putative DNA-binding domain-containing protein [Shewanella algae]MBO2574328.1 putative DNA-binding domain-containing protein [Shewanella algae]